MILNDADRRSIATVVATLDEQAGRSTNPALSLFFVELAGTVTELAQPEFVTV